MAQAWDQDNYQTLNHIEPPSNIIIPGTISYDSEADHLCTSLSDVVSNQKKDTQILQVHFKACIVYSLGEQRHHTIRCGQGETLQFIL